LILQVEDPQIEYYKKLEEILNDLAKKQQKKKLIDVISLVPNVHPNSKPIVPKKYVYKFHFFQDNTLS